MFAWMDTLRKAQGVALEGLGFGPNECAYQVPASGRRWRLRAYGGPSGGPLLLIVAAPIKRPYLWDLAPSVSAVRYCLRQRLRVYLLEWTAPSSSNSNAGLAEYAEQAIGDAVATVSRETGEMQPFLIGHSLGGTLAAIFGALQPQSIKGLVLLSAPLCFQPGVSRFRDAIVAMAPSSLSDTDVVPGSLLSQLSALASPETFLWSRLLDATLSSGDPLASEIHARVERWALDEVSLPGRLVHQMLAWLYRENQLCRGTLQIGQRTVGPSCLRLPTLAVVNTADGIAPLASVIPFFSAMPGRDVRVLEFPGEVGVALQHLGILVGRQAYARVWPEIISWLRARC
jgi:polyhydroxyalkanoate synthase subunit PhaC